MENVLDVVPEGDHPFPREQPVHQQRHDDAHRGVKDAVQGVAHIRMDGRAEQNDAQHHAAGLHAAGPEGLTQLDERDDADKELETYKKLLEEEANREQLPKKKVIPYRVLDAVPLLGKGVMTGLVPVLAKYNIVVDYNK